MLGFSVWRTPPVLVRLCRCKANYNIKNVQREQTIPHKHVRLRNQGSPGYNANDFYPHSSYLRDFVATGRRQGILFGESSVPVAAYVRGVDLFNPVTQQVRQLIAIKNTKYISSGAGSVAVICTSSRVIRFREHALSMNVPFITIQSHNPTPSCSTNRFHPALAVHKIPEAILDLEAALVSSSPSTIAITSSLDRDAIIPGKFLNSNTGSQNSDVIVPVNATSSWLRGFLEWLPSSSYTSEVAGGGDEKGLWVGAADLFNEAVNEFISESRYQR